MDKFLEEINLKLEDLRVEWDAGQKMLAQLEAKEQDLQRKRENLQQTMLRICGAIQVLEEILPDTEEQ